MFIPKEFETLKLLNKINNAEKMYREWLSRKKQIESLDYV